MTPRLVRRSLFAAFALLAFARPGLAGAQVRVVNMIPLHFSNEAFQNSEPSLTINPAKPGIMAASTLTLGANYCARAREAAIYVTVDTGASWQLICKLGVDSASTPFFPGDLILRWSPDGASLFASLLWPLQGVTAAPDLQVFRTDDVFGPQRFALVNRITAVDQPDMLILDWQGRRHALVAANFKNLGLASPNNASAGVWMPVIGDGGADTVPVGVESRKINGQNFAIRLAMHPGGTVYAGFVSPLPPGAAPIDYVVVRDDSAGQGAAPFTALREPVTADSADRCTGRDGRPGVRVARCVNVPVNGGADPLFGFQRRSQVNVSIAVNPRDARDVMLSWADSMTTAHYTLHVRRSTDGGATWSQDLTTVANATNPSLAITDEGVAGFLFQQLVDSGPAQRWASVLRISRNGFATFKDIVLSSTPVHQPAPLFNPYIGDYAELRASGSSFMGVFSASNAPNMDFFPSGVTFLRNADFTSHRLLDFKRTGQVAVSIDPFFFRVGPVLPDIP